MALAAAFVAGWLVWAGPIDGEVADELVVDEHGGVGVVEDYDGVAVGVTAADVDDEFLDADVAGVVGLDVAADVADKDRMLEGFVGWRGGGCGCEASDWDLAADSLVRSFMVVDPAELVELGLELGEVSCEGLFAEPFLQGLLEPFDLAGGLRVVGAPVERADPDVAELGLEQHFESA